MPGSVRENDEFVKDFVISHEIETVLDVGVGQGTYSDILREHVKWIDGVEAWAPYVEEFGLHEKYNNLFVTDAREELKWLSGVPELVYDLVIFGDVLEHMTREQSIEMWTNASYVARYGLISVPIIHYPQGAEFGNPYEVHVQEHLTPEDVREDYGPFVSESVYDITATFIRRFE